MAAPTPDVSTNEALSPKSSALVHNSTSPCCPDDERQFHVVQSSPKHDKVELREDTNFSGFPASGSSRGYNDYSMAVRVSWGVFE
ncbi:hypothetical protein PVK06_017022 [Gossypium arboreum]|uniref:Uncharacterized protein n=1 Tax=Gossypium arboreum TaxID=29729 RepID=A0ABR0Q1L5_GOSAR|nr:hypothetical protein PVK06_017022 [Gossypium arboreum]